MEEVSEILRKYGPIAARILIAQLFIVSGIGKIGGFAGTAGFMQGAGLPMAHMLLAVTIVLEIGGGILLVLGWKARCAAAALCLFTFLTAMIFHAFWSSDAASLFGQLNNFMKNLAIMGGLFYVMLHGAGPLSMDGARESAAGDGKSRASTVRKRKT
jgi:putative oxidoreductase